MHNFDDSTKVHRVFRCRPNEGAQRPKIQQRKCAKVSYQVIYRRCGVRQISLEEHVVGTFTSFALGAVIDRGRRGRDFE